MAENSKIEWCDHTFNPWVGCTKVSPACDHCYAESWAKRTGQPQIWQGHRRRTSEANWRQPLKWHREASRGGSRPRVFCASLADVFDNQVPARWRDDLWHCIDQTPHLDWLLLTKRPKNIAKMLPDPRTGTPAWGEGWPNVWLGTTAENQAEAERRIPWLLAVPAAVRFLSCEPLLGPIALGRIDASMGETRTINALTGEVWYPGCGSINSQTLPGRRIDWVIAGGESGPGARPMHPAWARSLRDQCAAAGVPYHFKQFGNWLPINQCKDTDWLYAPAPVRDPEASRRCHFPAAVMHTDGSLHSPAATGAFQEGTGAMTMFEVGKSRAGRLLDGVEHNGMPGYD